MIILVHEAARNIESRVIGFSGASRPITPDAMEEMSSPVLETEKLGLELRLKDRRLQSREMIVIGTMLNEP